MIWFKEPCSSKAQRLDGPRQRGAQDSGLGRSTGLFWAQADTLPVQTDKPLEADRGQAACPQRAGLASGSGHCQQAREVDGGEAQGER